jgi:hypothetical protein
MIKNKELLRYAQLQDSSSGRCLGTVSSAGNTLGLVDCNDRDPLQFWDLRDVYNNTGVLRKSYNVGNSVDIAGFDISTPELANDPTGNQITIMNKSGVYNYTSQPWGVEAANGIMRYNASVKSLRDQYFSNDSEPSLDTCVNAQGSGYAAKIGNNGNKQIDSSSANLNQQCDTKWNVLVKSCSGNPQHAGYECNRATGEYTCKKGFFGKNCDFKSSTTTVAADAYDNFFNACYEGSAAYENPSLIYSTLSQSCARLNNQEYIPADLADQFYDVVNKTNNRYNDNDFSNKRKLLEVDGQYDRDFATKSLYVNTEIAKLDDQKVALSTTNGAIMAAKQSTLAEKQKANDALKQQLATPQVVDDILEPIKSIKTNTAIAQATARGTLASKNGELSATKNKINDLQNTLAAVQEKINGFINACKQDGLICTIKNL